MNVRAASVPTFVGIVATLVFLGACKLDTVGHLPLPPQEAVVARALIDGGVDAAAVAIDGSRIPGPAAPDASPSDPACDGDRDGYPKVACGGTDCCDDDDNVFPGTKKYFGTRTACGTFDYDCDGTESLEYGLKNCVAGTLSCTGDGFDNPTTCGDRATFITCNVSLLEACSEDKSLGQQRCR